MCSYFIVENKIIYKMSFAFFGRVYISREGVKFSKISREVAHKGGDLTDLSFLGGLGKKG